MNALLYSAIVVGTISITLNAVTLFMLWRQRNYFDRIMKFGHGLADIQDTIKTALLEHHTLMNEVVDEAKDEILKHITFTSRWLKVIARLIKIKETTPLANATISGTVKEAEAMHEVGLEIAKTAFEDKKDIEDAVEDANNRKPLGSG